MGSSLFWYTDVFGCCSMFFLCHAVSTNDIAPRPCLSSSLPRYSIRCKDDRVSSYFKNGASFHYRFSDMPVKSIDREMASFGLAPEDVDAVLVNVGNGPQLSLDSVAQTAVRFKGSNTLLLWLTTFQGRGLFHDPAKQKRLADTDMIQVSPFSLLYSVSPRDAHPLHRARSQPVDSALVAKLAISDVMYVVCTDSWRGCCRCAATCDAM